MAQTDKFIGHGTLLKLSSTTISRVRSITPAPQTREPAEGTTLDSVVEDFLPGDPPNAGDLVVDLVWKPGATNDQLLETDFAAKTIGSWSIVYPSGVGYTDSFSGWIKALTPAQIESKTVISRQVTICLTTAITRAAS